MSKQVARRLAQSLARPAFGDAQGTQDLLQPHARDSAAPAPAETIATLTCTFEQPEPAANRLSVRTQPENLVSERIGGGGGNLPPAVKVGCVHPDLARAPV